MTVAGQGAHSDIVMASALALVNALNRLQGRVRSAVLRRQPKGHKGRESTNRVEPASGACRGIGVGLSANGVGYETWA